jgi:hypothetical protein
MIYGHHGEIDYHLQIAGENVELHYEITDTIEGQHHSERHVLNLGRIPEHRARQVAQRRLEMIVQALSDMDTYKPLE